MQIFHIKDKDMFNTKNGTGSHRYAVFTDRKSKEVRAVELTHLYEIPFNKQKRINNGYIKELKLSCYKLPSGVSTEYVTKDINGKPLNMKTLKVKTGACLGAKESKKIIKIAKNRKN